MAQTERDKMLAGLLYNPHDAELTVERERSHDLCQQLNATREGELDKRKSILRQLLGYGGEDVQLQPPFFCDDGTNIHLGRGCYFNFNCIVLDVCKVAAGDHAMFGPAVQIYTATHPLDADMRCTQEFGKPVSIGSDVWVGSGAIICPGVSIGCRTVIGADSVVTRDAPDGVLAAENPCRVIRGIDT